MMKTKIVEIIETNSFQKDIKTLARKYKSLPKDFEIFCNDLKKSPKKHIPIEGIGEGYIGAFYKVKKFRCKSLSKNSQKSGIRIIYRYLEINDTTELEFIQIDFIEMYHKSTNTEFDYKRLLPYNEDNLSGRYAKHHAQQKVILTGFADDLADEPDLYEDYRSTS